MIAESQMKKIVKELSERDHRFATIIKSQPLCTIGQNSNPITHFEALVESVISQQLAVKAADVIYGRVKTLANGRVTPARIAAIAEADMRQAGLSAAKFKTIQGLAHASESKLINFKKYLKLIYLLILLRYFVVSTKSIMAIANSNTKRIARITKKVTITPASATIGNAA